MSALPSSHPKTIQHDAGSEPVLIIRQPATLEAVGTDQRPDVKSPFRLLEDSARGHLIAMLGEYIGTTMFLFFGFIAAQTANEKLDNTLRTATGAIAVSNGPSLIQIGYISSVFGLSLAINVFIWYRVSGGMFNPAISFGLWLVGAFNWVRLVCVIPMQLLGAITAAGFVSGLLPGRLQAENSVGPNISSATGFAMESFLTFELMMTILFLAVEKSRVSFMAPWAIGVTVLIIHLVSINVSGASVNPARSFGPAVVNGNFVPEFWIYWVGPFLGASVGAGVYILIKAMGYQTANPGQDGDGMESYRVVPPSESHSVTYSSYASQFPKVPATARYTSTGSPRKSKASDGSSVRLHDLGTNDSNRLNKTKTWE